MVVGHMDGLGRVLSILGTEGESAVQIAAGEVTPEGQVPDLDEGRLQLTRYYTNRPDLLELLGALGVPAEVFTANELLHNPKLTDAVVQRPGRKGNRDSRRRGNDYRGILTVCLPTR